MQMPATCCILTTAFFCSPFLPTSPRARWPTFRNCRHNCDWFSPVWWNSVFVCGKWGFGVITVHAFSLSLSFLCPICISRSISYSVLIRPGLLGLSRPQKVIRVAHFFVTLGPSFLYNLMLTVFLCVKDRKLQKAQLCASVNCFPPAEDQISIGPIRPMVKRDNKQLPERSNRTNPKINLCHAWDRRSEIRPKKTPRPQKHRRNTRKKINL